MCEHREWPLMGWWDTRHEILVNELSSIFEARLALLNLTDTGVSNANEIPNPTLHTQHSILALFFQSFFRLNSNSIKSKQITQLNNEVQFAWLELKLKLFFFTETPSHLNLTPSQVSAAFANPLISLMQWCLLTIHVNCNILVLGVKWLE